MLRPVVFLALVASAGVLAAPVDARELPAPSIAVVGTRADLVSGDQVLVRLTGQVTQVTADGRQRIERHGDLARVSGLTLGRHVLVASNADTRAPLEIIVHPRGGPLLSGPQVQPWICTTDENGLGPALDAQCNGRRTVTFRYKSAATQTFQDYDPSSPPPAAAVATTTTDQGRTVPYVVGVESGTLNRGIYSVALLLEPGTAPEPWAPPPGWNGKLLYLFGQGCTPGHSQGSPLDVVNDTALSRGYAVASATTSSMGNVCNLNVAAETVAMVKEQISKTYGPIRFTMGEGCSGGSESQNSLADNYPGLLDGVRPTCTFPDAWTPSITTKSDCDLLEGYFDANATLWLDHTQRAAVLGFPTELPCAALPPASGISANNWDPTTGCGNDSAPWMYHPVKNPGGTRCTLQDLNVAALGRRPDGKANGVLDDVGVEWGLDAAVTGAISTEQFVDLNEKVGGWTIDHQHQPSRTRADRPGVARMYLTGQLTTGRNVGRTPSIDARTDDTFDLHGNAYRDALRARVQRSIGSTDLQVFWNEPGTLPSGVTTPQTSTATFTLMDTWLSSISGDPRPWALEAKARAHQPAEARDACVEAGVILPTSTLCEATTTTERLPRMVAGMPARADVLVCALQPLSREAHASQGLLFTAAQWQRLQGAFPSGVCDYGRLGVLQQPPLGDWITLATGSPRLLGPAPMSRATRLHAVGSRGRSLPATGLMGAPVAFVALSVGLALVRRTRRPRPSGCA